MILHKTRFRDAEVTLLYGKIEPGCWSIFVRDAKTQGHRRVGPLYTTKDELLADLPRYAEKEWGME